MTQADARTSEIIRKELRDGTPDTPQRVATIERANGVYRKMAQSRLLRDIQEWIARVNHDMVRQALHETQYEFRLPDDWHLGRMHPGHLLHFIETLAEHTLQ